MSINGGINSLPPTCSGSSERRRSLCGLTKTTPPTASRRSRKRPRRNNLPARQKWTLTRSRTPPEPQRRRPPRPRSPPQVGRPPPSPRRPLGTFSRTFKALRYFSILSQLPPKKRPTAPAPSKRVTRAQARKEKERSKKAAKKAAKEKAKAKKKKKEETEKVTDDPIPPASTPSGDSNEGIDLTVGKSLSLLTWLTIVLGIFTNILFRYFHHLSLPVIFFG